MNWRLTYLRTHAKIVCKTAGYYCHDGQVDAFRLSLHSRACRNNYSTSNITAHEVYTLQNWVHIVSGHPLLLIFTQHLCAALLQIYRCILVHNAKRLMAPLCCDGRHLRLRSQHGCGGPHIVCWHPMLLLLLASIVCPSTPWPLRCTSWGPRSWLQHHSPMCVAA